jgi:hypothetical protein
MRELIYYVASLLNLYRCHLGGSRVKPLQLLP